MRKLVLQMQVSVDGYVGMAIFRLRKFTEAWSKVFRVGEQFGGQLFPEAADSVRETRFLYASDSGKRALR